ARGATTADDVSHAFGERRQLARERGGLSAAGVEAAGGAPARVGGAGERAQACVRTRATMLDRRSGHVHDTDVSVPSVPIVCSPDGAGAVGRQAVLPLLL